MYLQIFFVEFLPQPPQTYSVLRPVRMDNKNMLKVISLLNDYFFTLHIDVSEEQVKRDSIDK